MGSDSPGSYQLQAACVGDGFRFMVEVEEDFDMIRNETNRNHNNIRAPIAFGELT